MWEKVSFWKTKGLVRPQAKEENPLCHNREKKEVNRRLRKAQGPFAGKLLSPNLR